MIIMLAALRINQDRRYTFILVSKRLRPSKYIFLAYAQSTIMKHKQEIS